CGCSCCGCYSCGCHGCCGCCGCHGRRSHCGCCGCHCYGCYGCYSCCGCWGYACCGCWGGYGGGGVRSAGRGGKKRGAPGKEDGGAMLPAQATIVVSLPADAKLMVDGSATKSTAATRVFTSPALERDQDYFYNLTAEMVRDGQTLTASKRVLVRAGGESRVTIE